MKYQRLVSSTTPSSLQDWLGQELEDRGIDNVYARSILSLLQQDYVDIEPHECQHARSRQLKVLQKYGGPGKSFYATKSKHQKWRTREMQILLTSTYSCCNAVLPDLEKLKKKAAVECLRSASDYINDIEELIDEVCIKLKNIKNLKEKEDNALRKIMDPFFIPPSSPTDEIEKYFAAFPPLNGKTEAATVDDQHKISKNAWCKRCVLKRKSDSEVNHESGSASFRGSSKCTQPIIPYSSLKTIKNVYKNENKASEAPNKQESISLTKLKISVFKKNPYQHKTTVVKILSWDTKIIQSLQFSLKNLSAITIYQYIKEEPYFVEHLHTMFPNLAAILSNEECTDALVKFITKINLNSGCSKNKTSYDIKKKDSKSHSILIQQQEEVPEIDIFKSNSFLTVSACHVLGSECSKIKPVTTGLDDHFKMSPLSDLFDYFENTHLDTTQNLPFSLGDYTNASACSFTENASVAFENVFDFVNETDTFYSKNETCCTLKENLFSNNERNCLGRDVSLWEQGNSAFHALPVKKLVHVLGNDEVASSEMKLNEEVCSINNLNEMSNEDINMFPEIMSSNKEIVLSDEEIFYSDDESNEIFHSDEEENLFTSIKTHFQPIKISCSSTDVNSEVNVHTKDVKSSLNGETSFQYIFKIDPEDDTIENLEVFSNFENKNALNAITIDKVTHDAKNKSWSLSSSCEELASITQFIVETPCDKNACEQKYQNETSQKLRGKGTNTEILNKQFSPTGIEQNENTTQIFTSSKPINPECVVLDNLKTCNKMWLFHWGDKHNFITRTWQKDNYSPTLEKQSDKMFNYEVNTTLYEEIKVDGEELLKGLCSFSEIPNDTIEHESLKSVESSVHSNPIDIYSQNEICINEAEDILNLSKETSNDENLVKKCSKICTPVIDSSFTLDNIETSESENEIPLDYQDYKLCSSFYELDKYPDTRTIHDRFENTHLRKNNYLEGGGWSLASDSFSEECENIYERASSLGDLDLENSGTGFIEFYQQRKRLRCTSETNEEINQAGNKAALNLLQKRAKQKYLPRKRPCCFFLQGNCTRTDCRFSHDLSTTTCRFWKEGSCFKGMTCPFLHGYISENDQEVQKSDQYLIKDDLDNSYSLESESDFPSLSSVKTQASKGKSVAVDIIQAKSSKKNEERKLLN